MIIEENERSGNKRIIVTTEIRGSRTQLFNRVSSLFSLSKYYFTNMAFFKNKIVQILIFALPPLIIAFIVGYTSMGLQYPWYDTIKRPSWNPPAWVIFKIQCLQII